MFSSIRAIFLTIVWVFLALPYGIDAPTRSFIQESSLSNGAIVCEQTANGAEATFSLRLKQEYRPILSTHAFDDFELKVFTLSPDDNVNTDIAHSTYTSFEVIGNDEEYPPVPASYTCEIENDPYLIRMDQEFTVIVHLTVAKSVSAGTYSIAISPSFGQECIWRDALIVR